MCLQNTSHLRPPKLLFALLESKPKYTSKSSTLSKTHYFNSNKKWTWKVQKLKISRNKKKKKKKRQYLVENPDVFRHCFTRNRDTQSKQEPQTKFQQPQLFIPNLNTQLLIETTESERERERKRSCLGIWAFWAPKKTKQKPSSTQQRTRILGVGGTLASPLGLLLGFLCSFLVIKI